MIVNGLAARVKSISAHELPANVREAVKMHLTDYIAVTLAGAQLGAYRTTLQIYREPGDCTVIGTGLKTSMRSAAVINGFMAHSTWYEDGSRCTGGHPASSIFPALLALAEQRDASGEQLLEATVAGYEVFNRIGAVMYPATVRRGFLPTGLLSPIAASVACAKLLGLDAEGIANAISIATPLGSGLKSAFKSADVQPLQIGRGSEAGLVAALYAEQGRRGFAGNLEAFLKAHATNDGAAVRTDGDYEILNTYIKIHAGCRGNHAPLDAVLALVTENALTAADISNVAIDVDTVTAANEIHEPKDHLQAQFNIPFSVAAALKNGNAALFQFSEENLRDPQIHALMEKVSVRVDPELDSLLPDKRGARACIETKDGRRFETFTDIPEGEPERPLTREKMRVKFDLLTRELLGSRTDAVLACVERLEDVASVRELMGLLAC